ncbi:MULTISPECIES: hypothetical protein [Photobacterium]|uniref:Uncharacterized protein n=3 Tax=Photobacterium TaxID=657 RepID=A0A2N4UNJ7_9GAMM|nr:MULTISPECIES: hypothetical protein [Photobacterium]MBY3790058.1 hypothetical protein [Photobacterium carnosum]MCD9476667.1 hypothetical protein [Photobacterium phosphoreum]MCD9496919.1 hypothetical protein [Photobacterium carnosum]MCD9535667.1 hypothetical protein [Photobacterium carnosum]MCD9542704.1 hypothetical protein [Photobacterium carnosum]
MFQYLRYGMKALGLVLSTIIIVGINTIYPTIYKGFLMLLTLALIGLLFTPIPIVTALSPTDLQGLGRYVFLLVFGVVYLLELISAISISKLEDEIDLLIQSYQRDK